MDLAQLQAEYAAIHDDSARLAGDLLDIPRRVVLLNRLHRDSLGNHEFPLVAAHGALWAWSYFEVGGAIGRLIARRYFYHRAERTFRLALLDDFAAGFRRVNRQVCIDSLTNYEFVSRHGDQADAVQVIPAPLLDALNRVVHARNHGRRLAPAERRAVFQQSFHGEQEVTVAPGVAAAVAGFQCRIMRALCLRPLVRFAYFPRCTYLFFRNFADQSERIDKGMRAYDYAVRRGWDAVFADQQTYARMPRSFFADPHAAYLDVVQHARAEPSKLGA